MKFKTGSNFLAGATLDVVDRLRHSRQSRAYRLAFKGMLLWGLWGISLALGLLWSTYSKAAPKRPSPPKPKVTYTQKTSLDFEGAEIEGELKKPGEFYFQHRPEEKFDSLVKRRPHFHREMLRDAVLSK